VTSALRLVISLAVMGCGQEHSTSTPAMKDRRADESEPTQASSCTPPHGWDLVPREITPPEFPAELPVRARGDSILSGSVVSGDGRAIAGARVRFVSYRDYSESTPHGALLGAAVTRESGSFALSYHPLVGPDVLSIVIDAGELTREIDVPVDQLDQPWRIRVSPVRRLPISVHCTELFEEEALYAPEVEVLWPSSDANARDVFWASTVLTPRTCEYRREGETDFDGEVDVPLGAVELKIAGHCGRTTHRLDVADGDGPLAPLRVSLPEADSGALEIRFTAPEPPPCPREYCRLPPWSTTVWHDPDPPIHFTLWRSVRGGSSAFNIARLRGLPPGEYHLGFIDSAHEARTVRIGPRETTVLEMSWRNAEVREASAVD
jgi:hypothetical protein